MHTTPAFTRLALARVGVLATVRPDGRPHAVPVVYAMVDDTIVTAVDHKPKSTTRLQRLANVRSNPQVSLLAQHYREDWTALWWVRADGKGTVVEAGPTHAGAIEALVAKYEQYRRRPPSGPVIVIAVDQIAGWGDLRPDAE